MIQYEQTKGRTWPIASNSNAHTAALFTSASISASCGKSPCQNGGRGQFRSLEEGTRIVNVLCSRLLVTCQPSRFGDLPCCNYDGVCANWKQQQSCQHYNSRRRFRFFVIHLVHLKNADSTTVSSQR